MKKNKNRLLAVAVLALGLAIGFLCNVKENNDLRGEISYEKPNPGEKPVRYELILNAGDEVSDYSYSFNVEGRKLDESEQEQKLDEALEIWREKLLEENTSQNYVDKSLNVFDELCDGLVKVRITFDYTLISPSGSIDFEKVADSGTLTEIKAVFKCGEKEAFDNMYVVLYKPKPGRAEEIINAVDGYVSGENNSVTKDFVLPQEALGETLSWRKKKSNTGTMIMILGFLAAIGIFYGSDFDEKKELAKRNAKLEEEYILLLRQLSVLTRAGMTVMAAFERIAESYVRRTKAGFLKTPVIVYEEIMIMLRKVKDGCGESDAYKSLGDSCQLPCYRKLTTLLIQNYKKGSRNLSTLLEDLLDEEYTKQKALIKKRGEELSTKLLLPMMIMLILVMVIVTVPAMGAFEI